jgi:hypothetical protein
VDELAELIANTHARWMPRVVEAIFGTNDPVSVAEELSEAVAAALAVPVVAAQFYEPGVGVVVGLDLADGRAVVAKVHRATFMPLEHRRCLVAARTLMLHYAQDQLAKLPTEIRDQLPTTGKIR